MLMRNEKVEIDKEKVLLEDSFGKAGNYVPVAQGYHQQGSRLRDDETVMHDSMG